MDWVKGQWSELTESFRTTNKREMISQTINLGVC